MIYNYIYIAFAPNNEDKGSTKAAGTQNLTPEEQERMHEAYSKMGHQGGKKGGETRKEQLGHEGYVEMGKKGGETRKEQMAKGGTHTHKEENNEKE